MNRTKLLQKLSALFYRQERENAPNRFAILWSERADAMGFCLLAGLTLITFVLLFAPEASRWHNTRPAVAIAKAAWRTIPAGAKCSRSESVDDSCPASVRNNELWQSAHNRSAANGELTWHANHDYWIGTVLSEEQVALAHAQLANNLILGYIYGAADVWVNGAFFAELTLTERSPLVLTLPVTLLSARQELKVAILVHPYSSGRADVLAFPWHEGLADAKTTADFRSADAFWHKSIPLSLFFLNLLFASVFFALWLVDRKKQEYIFIALFGCVSALAQIRFMDIFRDIFTNQQIHYTDTIMACSEAGFGLLLALSFARGRRRLFTIGIPLTLASPWVLRQAYEYFHARFNLTLMLSTWLVPFCYALGGALCLLQAAYLWHSGRRHVHQRIHRLVLFALGLLIMAALPTMTSEPLVDILYMPIVARISHFALVLFIGAIALLEYHFEHQLLEKSPLSRYHRQAKLPTVVKGAILAVDLKNSERLYRLGVERGDPGRLVSACLSQIWSAVIRHNGTVLESEGDGLIAIFDALDTPHPVLAALQSADLIRQNLNVVRTQFRDQFMLSEAELNIEFRAGLSAGDVQPIWHKVKGIQVAGWVEAGASLPFVDCARLMDIERQVHPEGHHSTVLVSAGLVSPETRHHPALQGQWLLENASFNGKHNVIYSVHAYQPYSQKLAHLIVVESRG